MIYFITTIVLSLSVSFLCSLFEACLLSLSHNDIAEISLKNPKLALIWKNFKGNIQKPIAVILIINTIAHTIGASLSGAHFDELFGPKWIVIYSLAFSFAMIQWTEILPKTLGVKYNKKIAGFITIPLVFLLKLFTPLVKIIEIINLPFVGKKDKQENTDIINEISVLSKFAFNSNLITKDQEKIITRTVSLSTVKARDIMIDKSDIKHLTSSMSMMDALIEAHIHNHTRLPLIDSNDSNKVLGYINFKDIVSALQINPVNPSLIGIVRPVLTIFEDETFPNIFKKLSSKHQHISIVMDRKNNFSGLITLEDLIEEIVGEIEDEYDLLQTHFYSIAANRFIVGGGLKISAINNEWNLKIDNPDMTINEWVLKNEQNNILPGKKYELNEIKVIIKKISRGRVSEAIIEKK